MSLLGLASICAFVAWARGGGDSGVLVRPVPSLRWFWLPWFLPWGGLRRQISSPRHQKKYSLYSDLKTRSTSAQLSHRFAKPKLARKTPNSQGKPLKFPNSINNPREKTHREIRRFSPLKRNFGKILRFFEWSFLPEGRLFHTWPGTLKIFFDQPTEIHFNLGILCDFFFLPYLKTSLEDADKIK